MLTGAFRPGRRTSVNCYLIYSAGRLALVETGSGDYLLPTAGKLQQNLKAAGVNPADIDTVITDAGINPKFAKELTKKGIKVIKA